jgi:transcriptional antiterminator RfaH
MSKAAAKESWFAVCCKPRQESVAEENLARQGFRVYLPRISIRKYARGQWRNRIEALFPRYVFVQLDPQLQSTTSIRSTRGAVGLVKFGNRAAAVPDAVIGDLLERQEKASGLHLYCPAEFQRGEAIRMVDGPLAGIEGVFSEPDGNLRVIVLLELLGKANEVKVSRDWIAKTA